MDQHLNQVMRSSEELQQYNGQLLVRLAYLYIQSSKVAGIYYDSMEGWLQAIDEEVQKGKKVPE